METAIPSIATTPAFMPDWILVPIGSTMLEGESEQLLNNSLELLADDKNPDEARTTKRMAGKNDNIFMFFHLHIPFLITNKCKLLRLKDAAAMVLGSKPDDVRSGFLVEVTLN